MGIIIVLASIITLTSKLLHYYIYIYIFYNIGKGRVKNDSELSE